MAQSTLASFPVSGFPQLLEALVGGEIRRVERVLLSSCSNESGESCWGAGDSVTCRAKATVFDLVTESEYCAKCFQEVSRGH